MAAVLVIGAGLLLRSFETLLRVDPGFAPRHLLTLRVSLPRQRYGDNQRTTAFYRELTGRLRTLPRVITAAAASSPPLGGPSGDTLFEVEGRAAAASGGPNGLRAPGGGGGGAAGRHAYTWVVTPGYFQAVAVPLLRGRPISAADGAASPLVAVVNETLVRKAWPGLDPIGKRFRLDLGPATMGPWIEVAGVVRDVAIRRLDEAPQPEAFLPEA